LHYEGFYIFVTVQSNVKLKRKIMIKKLIYFLIVGSTVICISCEKENLNDEQKEKNKTETDAQLAQKIITFNRQMTS
jgi:large-conductance mechanosensitive channel